MSIGSNDQWGFETEVVSATGCHTHTFECTISRPLNKPNLDSVSFYSACISHEDDTVDGRKYTNCHEITAQNAQDSCVAGLFHLILFALFL